MISGIYGRFLWAITHGFGVSDGFKRPETPSHEFDEIVKKTLDFGHVWPFSWAIAHCFGVSGGFKQSGPHHMSFTKS